MLRKKKKLGKAENMQFPWTGIPEIKPWSCCVFHGSITKKSQNFVIPGFGKKEFKDSVLISLKYSNSMHRDISNQTVDLLCFYGSKTKKSQNFRIPGCRKTKLKDSVLISSKYANSKNWDTRIQTMDLFCIYRVQNEKTPKFRN